MMFTNLYGANLAINSMTIDDMQPTSDFLTLAGTHNRPFSNKHHDERSAVMTMQPTMSIT
jgi:hypothetical protein